MGIHHHRSLRNLVKWKVRKSHKRSHEKRGKKQVKEQREPKRLRERSLHRPIPSSLKAGLLGAMPSTGDTEDPGSGGAEFFGTLNMVASPLQVLLHGTPPFSGVKHEISKTEGQRQGGY